MKISQIITERYENQDPNRPPDFIIDHQDGNTKIWYDTNRDYHRDGDLPAYIDERLGTQVWYQHGNRHRDGDEPAFLRTQDNSMEWWKNGNLHRETGPAALSDGGYIRFALNGLTYSVDEWLEEVADLTDMPRYKFLIMKNKYGLH